MTLPALPAHTLADIVPARLLNRGAEFIERPAYDAPQSIDILIGRSGYLCGYPRHEFRHNNWQLAGWTREADDHELAVIALRQQAARERNSK